MLENSKITSPVQTANQQAESSSKSPLPLPDPVIDDYNFVQLINRINFQKWYINISLHIGNKFTKRHTILIL